jgi:glycosyltransferase involved in cell wall biosynthesis
MVLDNPAVLYISYDGVLEPLGQSQVLSYLEELAREHAIYLISFEKKKDRENRTRFQAMYKRLSAVGITWVPLAYHKTPSVLATAYDIAIATGVALYILVRRRVRIVHARSYVAALVALIVKRLTGARFLFDMRGFWADERVDAGVWRKSGLLYHVTKALERRFLLAADHVVTLTNASARVLAGCDYLKGRLAPLTVITTCADLERFRPLAAAPGRPFTFGYVGSIVWYMFDEMLSLFKVLAARRPGARLLVVNRNEQGAIRVAVEKAGIAADQVELVAAEHHEVPSLIARMHAAGAIIRPGLSSTARAPTKVGEYLGCGVPCVGNTGVGDMEEILEGNRVGVALTDFNAADLQAAADRLLALIDDPGIGGRCVDTARRLFSLEAGVEAYRAIYKSLAGGPEALDGTTGRGADRVRRKQGTDPGEVAANIVASFGAG